MKRYMLIVMSNPVKGKEEEYHQWYIEQHIPDSLKIKGFINGQLLSSASQQHPMQNKHEWSHVAIFDLATDNINALLDDLNNRMNTPLMPFSDVFDFDYFHLQLFGYPN